MVVLWLGRDQFVLGLWSGCGRVVVVVFVLLVVVGVLLVAGFFEQKVSIENIYQHGSDSNEKKEMLIKGTISHF